MSLSKRIPYMCIVLTSIKHTHTHTLNICARLLNDSGDTEVQLTFISANLGQEKHTHTQTLCHILIWKGFNSSTKVQIDHLQSKLGN